MSTIEQYKIRCKCQKCRKTQVRRISDVLNGEKCFLNHLGKPPCGGNLEYFTDDSQDAIGNMAAILGYLSASPILNANPRLAELVDTVAEDISQWMEGEQTPQQMGWVGQNGLP